MVGIILKHTNVLNEYLVHLKRIQCHVKYISKNNLKMNINFFSVFILEQKIYITRNP